jgi:hypothetical protein
MHLGVQVLDALDSGKIVPAAAVTFLFTPTVRGFEV